MQGRRVIVDAEQRRRIEAIRSEGRAARCVVSELEWIRHIKRPHILEILERRGVAGKREELIRQHWGRRRRREPGDTWIEWRTILSDCGWIVAVEDLALGPFRPAVARGAIGCKKSPAACQRRRVGLRLVKGSHGR